MPNAPHVPPEPASRDASAPGQGDGPERPEESLRAERHRMVRERWMHLLLLGFALSVVAHVAIMLRLWWTKLPERPDALPASIELRLQELPPAVEMVNEEIELPDPSPEVMGPVTVETDPLPNLSSEQASDNPNADLYGAIEAPGIGAIAGPGGAGGGIGIGSGKGGGGTSFFGIGGRGTRFAYVVDVSGSMDQENRLRTALSELKRSIGALPDFAQFYVVLFSDGAFVPDFATEGWLRATRANVGRMRQWLDTQTPRGGTYPLQAFENVFKLPQPPDVIFFLTDGEIPGETAYHVSGFVDKAGREVVINTVGFSSEAGKGPLQEIARAHRGVFRFVPTSGGGGAP